MGIRVSRRRCVCAGHREAEFCSEGVGGRRCGRAAGGSGKCLKNGPAMAMADQIATVAKQWVERAVRLQLGLSGL